MKEYFKRFRFNNTYYRVDPNSKVNHLAEKFAAQVIDMQDKALVDAIVKEAEKSGFTEIAILDKDFILSAIRYYKRLLVLKEDVFGKTIKGVYRAKLHDGNYFIVEGEAIAHHDKGVIIYDPYYGTTYTLFYGEYVIVSEKDSDKELQKIINNLRTFHLIKEEQ